MARAVDKTWNDSMISVCIEGFISAPLRPLLNHVLLRLLPDDGFFFLKKIKKSANNCFFYPRDMF